MIRYLLLSDDNVVTTFTLKPTEDTIEVEMSDTLFDMLTEAGYSNYKYINGEFILRQDVIDREQAEDELLTINKWFNDTDYIPNKIVTGEWLENDQRWIDYKSERIIKRARRDELLLLLGIE